MRLTTRLITALLLTLTANVAATGAGKGVYILPIEDEIDARAWQHTKRACDEAMATDARIFIVRMNTYGGALDAADSIRTALLHMPIPTVAFIDHNAASAGALIALACDSVYMSPGASMGSATVVDGSGNPMPEKYQSYMRSIMRSTAQAHGKYMAEGDSVYRWRRDPAVAASMVNADTITAFTPAEAVEAGFAEGTAVSVEEVLKRLDIAADSPRHTFKPTASDDIIGFLSNAGVRAILVMLILGGIYMEMHTPGLGFAAAVAAVAACLYFLPMLITGTLASWIVITLIAGIVLIALEVFVIPGFGICGIAGICAVLLALFAAIIPPADVNDSDGLTLAEIATPIVVVCAGATAAIALAAWLTSKHGPKWVRRHSELMLTQDVKEGYIGVDMTPAELVGRRGRTLTDMRPAGKVIIDEKVYDAVSTGAFIEAGKHVRTVKYENAQLYVEPANIEEETNDRI